MIFNCPNNIAKVDCNLDCSFLVKDHNLKKAEMWVSLLITVKGRDVGEFAYYRKRQRCGCVCLLPLKAEMWVSLLITVKGRDVGAFAYYRKRQRCG